MNYKTKIEQELFELLMTEYKNNFLNFEIILKKNSPILFQDFFENKNEKERAIKIVNCISEWKNKKITLEYKNEIIETELIEYEIKSKKEEVEKFMILSDFIDFEMREGKFYIKEFYHLSYKMNLMFKRLQLIDNDLIVKEKSIFNEDNRFQFLEI